MQKAAKTSRLLIRLSSDGESANWESAASGKSSLEQIVASQLARCTYSHQLINWLAQTSIRLGEHAYSLRDSNALHEAGSVLNSLPLSNAQQISLYYQALAARQKGEIDGALALLETVADRAPLVYRARAIQALGAIHHRQGRINEALRLYPEALRIASPDNGRDLLTTLLVHLDISCIKSELGDHRGALAHYESLSGLVQIVARENPVYFYGYHNELAIEFAELGRTSEAEAASAISVTSRFAAAYPEWRETRDEIAAKCQSANPSTVAINRALEADLCPQIEPQRKPQPLRTLAFDHPAGNKDTFQRSVYSIPATATSALNAVSILDRVLTCIGPRAPPAPLIQSR